MLINIEQIKIENRIRKDFGNIQELADDIKQNGLINPPVVMQESDNTYSLLTGERRIRALKLLGYKQVEVRTWKSLNDEEKYTKCIEYLSKIKIPKYDEKVYPEWCDKLTVLYKYGFDRLKNKSEMIERYEKYFGLV